MASAYTFRRTPPLLVSHIAPSIPHELRFPPAALSDPEKEAQQAVFEQLDLYHSALPLSPRHVSTDIHLFPPKFHTLL